MVCYAMLSHFSRVRLCVTPQTAATRLPCPWDSPGKNTGVGCHFLLQCMKVKSESKLAQLCQTLNDRMDCSLPGSSIRGIFQAKVLESGATALAQHFLIQLRKTPSAPMHKSFSSTPSVSFYRQHISLNLSKVPSGLCLSKFLKNSPKWPWKPLGYLSTS